MNMPLHHIFSRVKQVKHSETTIKYVSFHEYSIHIPYSWKSYLYFIDIVDTLFNHSHVLGIPIATIADSSFLLGQVWDAEALRHSCRFPMAHRGAVWRSSGWPRCPWDFQWDENMGNGIEKMGCSMGSVFSQVP